jgi:hypothetical protein
MNSEEQLPPAFKDQVVDENLFGEESPIAVHERIINSRQYSIVMPGSPKI